MASAALARPRMRVPAAGGGRLWQLRTSEAEMDAAALAAMVGLPAAETAAAAAGRSRAVV